MILMSNESSSSFGLFSGEGEVVCRDKKEVERDQGYEERG